VTEEVLTPAAQVPEWVLLSAWAAASATSAARPVLAACERWQVTVRLKPPQGLRNFHRFDYEAWLFA
jgi:competence protein ComEC